MQNQQELRFEVLEFLKRNFIMSVAFSNENKPSSSILLYHVDDDFNFYFATHTDSYKAKVLKVNPKLSLSVWSATEMLIQADGSVEEVSDSEEKLRVIDKLAASAGKGADFWPPLFRIEGEGYSVFKITPFWLRKLDLTVDTITQEGSPLVEVELNQK